MIHDATKTSNLQSKLSTIKPKVKVFILNVVFLVTVRHYQCLINQLNH